MKLPRVVVRVVVNAVLRFDLLFNRQLYIDHMREGGFVVRDEITRREIYDFYRIRQDYVGLG